MKKSYLLVLLGSLLCGISLSGCGGTTTGYDPDNFLPNGTEENPYQIVKEPVTIEIFAPHSAGNPEYDTLKMFTYLEEITNLRFNFTTVDTGGYANRRASIWEDANYKPDLFLFNNPIAEQVQFQELGFNAFVPFNDDTYTIKPGSTIAGVSQEIQVGNIIDNYMPNYKAGLESNWGVDREKEDAEAIATLKDGKMYCTLSVKTVPRDLTFKMFINETWINNLNSRYNLGLKSPEEIKTIEDYLEILRAFKQYDANQNGDPNDEVPVTSKSLEYLRNFILASYGYVQGGVEIENDGSKFTYVPYTEAYRNYLKIANTMWTEGLMDASTFSITTDAQMATKGQKGILGSFSSAAPYIAVGYEYDDQYTAFGPLTSEYYTGTPLQLGYGTFIPDGACIPQTSAYVREVARLLDIMYSDLGAQLISYGVENEDWTWDDAEHTSWTFHVPDSWTGNQEDYRATITPNVGSGSALFWDNDFVGKMNDDIIESLNSMSERYMDYLKVPEPANYKFTSSEYEQISRIKAALDPQLEYLEASFVRGERDPYNDADWESFKETLKGYGADELVGYYNTMLARY